MKLNRNSRLDKDFSTVFKADLFSGALFIKLAMNVDLYLSIGILLLISAFFTIGGKCCLYCSLIVSFTYMFLLHF